MVNERNQQCDESKRKPNYDEFKSKHTQKNK